MTNIKSKFTAVVVTGIFLVAFGAVIAFIHWDLHRLIYDGNTKGFDIHLMSFSILCAIPGVVLAFILGYLVRLGTNPKTNWILPSIVLGAGAAIVTRTVVNKVQTERKAEQERKVFELRKARELHQLPPPLDEPKKLRDFGPTKQDWSWLKNRKQAEVEARSLPPPPAGSVLLK